MRTLPDPAMAKIRLANGSAQRYASILLAQGEATALDVSKNELFVAGIMRKYGVAPALAEYAARQCRARVEMRLARAAG
jgi:hypothetical protein